MPIIKKSEDMYDEPDDQSTTMEMEDEEEGSVGAVELLPKSIVGGRTLKVGDKLVLEVTAIYDDEIGVKYPESKSPEEANKTPPEEAEEELGEVEATPETEASEYV
jgi:hypothetical protein